MARGFRGFDRNVRPGEEPFVPFTQTFNYTGNVQILTVPSSGLYKLEVYGGRSGANAHVYGNYGKGGKSIGYAYLRKNEKLAIVCGGAGLTSGYNGGSKLNLSWSGAGYSGGAGGATHIAKYNASYGTLESYGNANTAEDYVLIVAGGAGAPSFAYGNGGAGGGLSGGNGTNGYYGTPVAGATQSTGYAFGKGQPCFYITDGSNQIFYGGGGGGWYGGYAGHYAGDVRDYTGGSGGSAWIDGVPEIVYQGVTYTPSTVAGNNNGDGYAYIERIA